MNVDNRDSLSEFQSSIFDASDGHQLVDFIRKKKGLRAQPQKIFDDVPTNRQSLHIEIQRLDVHEHNGTHAKDNNQQPEEEIQSQVPNENNTKNGVLESPKRMSIKSPTHSKTLMKRLSQSIGRRTLLKEFEKTLQESRFLPPTCSTPVTGDMPPNKTSTMKGKIDTVSQGNLNIVCTPITITDEDSSKRGNRSKQTADMAEDLQEQVELVLEQNSRENLLVNEACEDSEDDDQDNHHSITLRNRILSPLKPKNRQTYTIERDSVSGNLILSPSKSAARTSAWFSQIPKTPERRLNVSNLILSPSTSVGKATRYYQPKTPERSLNASRNTKLIVTPKQKQLLLSKFGRSSQGVPSPQKAPTPPRSRIPVFQHGNNAANHADPEADPHVESANLSQQHPETVKIIEQLQRQNTSNVPVIVIPVNQTFNQAPNPEPATSSATFVQSPRPLEPAPVASPAKMKSPPPPPSVPSSSSSAKSSPVKMNSLRLKDIITDDESSDYHPNFAQSRKVMRRKVKKSSNTSHSRTSSRLSNRPENKLSLTAKQPLNSSKVRQVIKPQQLTRMSDYEILDLRKRNSRGELRQSLKLTQRESSLLGKQMDLELLRRNIQERNYEDEVLQMEVLAAPPDEFCDRSVHRSQYDPAPPQFNDEFVDEMSGDKVSLNPHDRYSKSMVGQKPGRKKKKVSEHVERYLETSQKIQKCKYMNLSKRKLYSKGDSEECSSTDTVLLQKPSPPKRATKRRSSQRKSNNVPSRPLPPTQPAQNEATKASSPHISMSQQNISNESVKKSVQSEQFLPQTNEVSQKPVKKTRKNEHIMKEVNPVDPDRGTSFVTVNNQENLCRRSKREKKLPMAYWSSQQTEFRPLYDYNEFVRRVNTNHKKKTPITGMNLVANTKKVKVGESAKNAKKSTKGQNKQEKSKQTKQAKKPEEDLPQESENPLTVLNKQQSSDDNKGRALKKNSKKTNRTKEKSKTSSTIVDDPCPDITTLEATKKALPENEATISNNETSRTLRNRSKDFVMKLNPLSKSMLSPSIQGSSGCSSDVSSVQQIRLATIAEDTLPTVQQSKTNSTMAPSNKSRLSSELMPPPPSTEFIRSKKSSSKVKNSKRSAFRTEHDQSIADVSSDHLNKLFDQLKNSSVCPSSSDVTASLNIDNNSGQASAHSRPTESNSSLQSKCKDIAVLLPRMKVKKSAPRSEKVCDSGFSSEDMPSVPKQKGDVLLNWLKQMIVNSKSTSGADKGVAKILQADGFHTSSVEDLIFQEVDGVEYAFYDTKQPFSIGYIRFNPKTGKKKCTAKKFELNFVILSGKVNITVNDTKFDCKNGDLITVFIGTSYVIQNISNDPALVMVIKKQCLVN